MSEEDRAEQVRAEADRLVQRLKGARQRLGAARAPASPPQPRADEQPGNDDDKVRLLLTPTADRVAQLHGIARSLADGTLTDQSAEEAVRALSATQPVRRPR